MEKMGLFDSFLSKGILMNKKMVGFAVLTMFLTAGSLVAMHDNSSTVTPTKNTVAVVEYKTPSPNGMEKRLFIPVEPKIKRENVKVIKKREKADFRLVRSRDGKIYSLPLRRRKGFPVNMFSTEARATRRSTSRPFDPLSKKDLLVVNKIKNKRLNRGDGFIFSRFSSSVTKETKQNPRVLAKKKIKNLNF